MSDHVQREQVAVRAGQRGGQEAISLFQTDLTVESKADDKEVTEPSEAVTKADRAAQDEVVEEIERSFPEDTIIGEESETKQKVPEEGVGWLIDPIDGTYNYVRGLSHWATSIAVVEDEDPVVAVNELPVLGDTYVAGPDGVERNGEQITVSDRTLPEAATVAPVVIPPLGERGSYATGVARIVEEFGNIRRYGSAQVTLSLVAAGEIEGMIGTINPHPWDTVAGAFLVEQAGGTVTDIHGEPWSHDSPGIIASNGHIHDELIDVGATMRDN